MAVEVLVVSKLTIPEYVVELRFTVTVVDLPGRNETVVVVAVQLSGGGKTVSCVDTVVPS
jgi:hypothetical protein